MDDGSDHEWQGRELPHVTEDGLMEVMLGLSSVALGVALYDRAWLFIAISPLWLLLLVLWGLPLVRRFFIAPRLQSWWHRLPRTGKTGWWLLIADGLAALSVLVPVAYALLSYSQAAQGYGWLAQWFPLCLGAAIMFELIGLSYRLGCKRYRGLGVTSLLIGLSASLYEAKHSLEPLAVLAIGLGIAVLLVGVVVWGRFTERHPLPWQR